MDTDFSLIRRMKSGEEESFDTFVRKYYPDILKYCHYHGPRSCGEDLTQEVFIRFFQNLSGYSHIGKARNYLYTIAANLCRDAYKKKFRLSFRRKGSARQRRGRVGRWKAREIRRTGFRKNC